jgi:choice-of-anchor A domain-containing protein
VKFSLLATASALALYAGAASATPTAEQLIDSFDVIGLGNVTTGSEIVGPVLVLGNLSGGSNILDTSNAPVTLPGYAQVNIFGDREAGTSVEGAGQTVAIGGSDFGTFLGTTPTTGYVFPDTAAALTATLTGYSLALAAMPATGAYDPATDTFSGPAGAIFDITTAELNAAVGPGSGLLPGDVVNVDGADWTDNLNDPLKVAAIWNFYDAATLTFNGQLQSEVLAPFATAFLSTQPIDGVVCQTCTFDGEIHWAPPVTPNPPPISTSEPGTLALLGVALVALGWRRARLAT